MKYLVKRSSITHESSGCAIVPVFSSCKLDTNSKKLDDETSGAISRALANSDITGAAGETLLVSMHSDAPHRCVLVVGCGNKKDLNVITLNKIASTAGARLKKLNVTTAVSTLHQLEIKDLAQKAILRLLIIGIENAWYQYDDTLSKKKTSPALESITWLSDTQRDVKTLQKGLQQGISIGEGMATTRTLGNLPGNLCTPSYLAAKADEIQRGHAKLSTEILDEEQMQELGMNSLLSVSAGSSEPARLVVLQYKGGSAKQKPIVLVGKGITFDTGGISLKPGAAMDEMKFDMCGAASVLGSLQACASMALPLNVIGVIACAENMPGGHATKPGDVVTSMSGQTIEILNTDAEGRLVLCDALTYVERFQPDVVIDVATLTGACLVALGQECSGLMSNNDRLAEQLYTAGQSCGDRTWRLPIWDEYQPLLDSNFADIANIGGRWAGTITAACFLSRFTEKFKWAHLDIAGVAWRQGKEKNATGRPVTLLTQYLLQRARVA